MCYICEDSWNTFTNKGSEKWFSKETALLSLTHYYSMYLTVELFTLNICILSAVWIMGEYHLKIKSKSLAMVK
jgi:hypothetical protein